MSFFGFDPSQPPHERGHNTAAPGFGQHADPFASLSGTGNDNEAFDFEDTYDGLGDQLEETGDDFNDDTFGGGSADSMASKPVGKDFDFFGQTAKVSDAINEEQMRYSRQQPVVSRAAAASYSQLPMSRPARTGYERYQEPEYVPDMQVDANLWGVAPKQPPKIATPPDAAPSRKMMSLEEVEAAMRAQAKKPTQSQVPVQQQSMPPSQPQHQQPSPQQYQNFHQQAQLQQQQQQQQQYPAQVGAPPQAEQRQLPIDQQIHILQRPQVPTSQASIPSNPSIPSQPAHVQNMNRFPGQPHGTQRDHHHPHASANRHVITHPQQLVNLSEEERAAFLLEDAKRAKRNHKIFLLSKDNGLMTPQDKNFITRIQLQQLVTATGNPNEHGIDSALSEDFYYQVHSQIRGGPRQNPHQPLSNFAQTYLFQTGNRHGNMRRQARGGDNHVQRMEQQVQRAVEAAKNKPKNKQLVIEGSLGKISFSNAKTPKPLLNIKRTDSNETRPGHSPNLRKANLASLSGSNSKTVLTDIENVYNTLMELEDHERSKPRPLGHEEINPQIAGMNQDWNERQEFLNKQLWRNLRVHEPIGATTVHPFIAILSFNKGKKAIPRVFRHISDEQRATILTMIILHLDKLDVVRLAVPNPDGIQLGAEIRENIDLFQVTVMSSLFGFLHDADFQITTGVLGLILNLNIDLIARTRIGLSLLTMILSRAEITKQAGDVDERGWNDWLTTHNAFFDALEPTLPEIFPGTVNTGEDVYVWQFLAAIGIGASPEQQQRLVMAVKDRVMETVGLAKTLPPAMSSQRLANVNLFMRSIGLDVELLA